MESLESIRKPSTELGQSEATQALSWLPSMPSCIAVGTGVKWLRIYDLRRENTFRAFSPLILFHRGSHYP